jgi:hypothetical protein
MSTRQSQSASAVSVTPAHEDTYRVEQTLYGDQLMPFNLIISVPFYVNFMLCCDYKRQVLYLDAGGNTA